eukprot:6604115-Prymnesium_polylepis.1
MVANAAAPAPRLRWAIFRCLGLMADEFPRLSESHEAIAPMLIAGLADGCARVQAAAALACVNYAANGDVRDTVLSLYLQPLLTPLHRLLAAPETAGY